MTKAPHYKTADDNTIYNKTSHKKIRQNKTIHHKTMHNKTSHNNKAPHYKRTYNKKMNQRSLWCLKLPGRATASNRTAPLETPVCIRISSAVPK